MGNKVIRVKNGAVSKIEVNEKPVSIDDIEW
jgi:activator of 2-hydroxyglutaryl-CoA dehydratase